MRIDSQDWILPCKQINTYFFMFCLKGQAYSGGWVKVSAETLDGAKKKFARRFGERGWRNGEVVCEEILIAEDFLRRGYLTKGYFGAYCHETL